MKATSAGIAVCGLAFAISVAGCSEANNDVKTNLEKIPLPPGVSDKPVEKPFKSAFKPNAPQGTQRSQLPK